MPNRHPTSPSRRAGIAAGCPPRRLVAGLVMAGMLATSMPNCRAYDPAFAYETAALIKDGITRIVNGLEEEFHAKSPSRQDG